MRSLDAKQQQVHQSKKSSQTMEAEVKRLKQEAADARKQLEAAMEKNKQQSEEQARLDQHYQVLREAVQSGPQRELERLRQELKVVNAQLAIVAERCQLVSKIYESNAYRWAEEQHQHIEKLRRMRDEVQATTQAFIDHIRTEIEALKSSTTIQSEDSNIETSVARCQSEMNGLLASIRLYSQQPDA
ncbi:hypothetical protein BX666DRAFT_207670 [Dichotomocladium elegans]|nr:hypothetical protein BX666DRAFT_207670 [Dichotomocladium elegans]